MTLKASFNDGNTWPSEHHILLDEWAGFGYSCITSVDENTIGIYTREVKLKWYFNKLVLTRLLVV